MRASIAGAFLVLLAASPAAAVPIVTLTPSTIAQSPTQTLLSVSVDPAGTPISTLLFNFSSLATGLEILAIQSAEPGIIVESGPALVDGDYQASFSGFFFPDKVALFSVGTLTVEGYTPGTPLVLSGEFTDPQFQTIPVGPMNAATVETVPEPGTLGLVSLGLLGLALGSRRRAGSVLFGRR